MDFGLKRLPPKILGKGLSMNSSAMYALALTFMLALSACDKTSEKSSHQHIDQADAAISTDDAETCAAMPFKMGLHGDLTAYTRSARGLFHVKVEWSSPLTAGSLGNQATITFVNEHAEPLPLKLVSFKLFMPAMGHGSGKTDQLIVTKDEAKAHVWSLDQIYFSMPAAAGEWVADIEGGACGSSDKVRVVIPVMVQ